MFVSIFPLLVISMHSYSSAMQFTIFFILIWKNSLKHFFLQSRGSGDKLPSFLFSFAYFCVLSFPLFSSILFLNNFSGRMFLFHRFLFLFSFGISNMSFHSPGLQGFCLRNLSLPERWECGSYICKLFFFFLLSNFFSLSLTFWQFDYVS